MMADRAIDKLISDVTRRNWERLSTDVGDRLLSRANKKLSMQHVVPKEYFINKDHVSRVWNIRDYIIDCSYAIDAAIYSLALNLLHRAGLDNKEHVQAALSIYDFEPIDDLLSMELPDGELDLLGIIYQCLLSEGQKNVYGAYYTPRSVVSNMTCNLDFSDGHTFLDPCCGTGAFLMSLAVEHPSQLYGVEIDPIAAMIAKVNLLLKYKHHEFIPNIKCADFLSDESVGGIYDYIFTNPPWGASYEGGIDECVVQSGESFSYFLVKSYSMLSDRGVLRFLLPESILNVRKHSDIRKYILDTGALYSVTFYEGRFSGVVTRYVDLSLHKDCHSSVVTVERCGEVYAVERNRVGSGMNYVFALWRKVELDIIAQVEKYKQYTLSDSVWALGIVTGDNKRRLYDKWADGLEPIYTGREVEPYKLNKPKRYIEYNREQLQQVAKDDIYRAKEKLVYRFISNKPTFAYDNTGALFLNSANILVPQIPGMNIKTVMAFLNSRLFNFLYSKMFQEVKVLKGNLIQLPFPMITKEFDAQMVTCVDAVMRGDDNSMARIDAMVYECYCLSPEQISHIEACAK